MTQESQTPETTEKPKWPVGWAKPTQSKKYHYWREGSRSLCGNWASLFMPEEMFTPDDGKPQKDDCAGCRRKLEKIQAQEAEKAAEGETK